MVEVDLYEDQTQLLDLVDRAQQGESVFIRKDENHVIQLVPIFKSQRKSQFGCAKGMIVMSDDFDEPLEDFKEYMQ